MAVTTQNAHDIATRVLIAMAERPDDLARFMDNAGLQPSELRNTAENPDIFLFLLDYVVEDDSRICSLSEAIGMRPQDIMAARTALSGAGSYGWSAD